MICDTDVRPNYLIAGTLNAAVPRYFRNQEIWLVCRCYLLLTSVELLMAAVSSNNPIETLAELVPRPEGFYEGADG